MILIFGGNGFVGQHVARYLLDQGKRVVVTAHSRSATPPLLATDVADGRATVVTVDVTDPFGVMALVAGYRPKVVIDLSGHHPKALSPGRDVAFRTSALVNILESARLNAVDRVVLMSSIDVYWGLPTEQAPYDEDDPVPLLESDDHFIVQSWAKKSLEVIANLYRRQYGMDILFARASGIYGPFYRTYMNVPSRLVRAAVKGVADIALPGEMLFADGGYDQLYVKDAARGIGMIALAQGHRHSVYNVGSGGVPAYGAMAAAVRLAIPGCEITLPARPAAIPLGAMDGRWMSTSRIERELGFTPAYDVDAAIADYVAWMRTDGP